MAGRNTPSVITHKNMRFVVTAAPTAETLPAYVKELRRLNVSDLCRACEVTYDKSSLESEGIKVHEKEFSDGDPPPKEIITSWLDLVQERFGAIVAGGGGGGTTPNPMAGDETPAIAVHCIAGLGRAPVLVAIALIEAGFEPLDAVTFIRKQRKGAVNKRQLQYLESYRPVLASQKCCAIM